MRVRRGEGRRSVLREKERGGEGMKRRVVRWREEKGEGGTAEGTRII